MSEPASLATWLAHPLDDTVQAAIERLRRADDVQHIAVMPDVHLASDVCVGVALGTLECVYPQAVGRDIGCGMAALAFDIAASALDDERTAARVIAGLGQRMPSLAHSKSTARPWPMELATDGLSDPSLGRRVQRSGRRQLGTLGRGNHFCELQEDEEGRLWVMLHSGSRAVGSTIFDHHLRQARRESAGLAALHDERAAAYISDHQFARRFADANRHALLEMVREVVQETMGGDALDASLITCDHNHVNRERHFEKDLLVHRKGSMPAKEGLAGILPGSMGTASYHVVGRGSADSLASSAHGAGRCRSRTAARHEITLRDLERQMRGIWFDQRRAVALREEAPAAYKDVRSVLRAQSDLVRVIRTLKPRLSYKAS